MTTDPPPFRTRGGGDADISAVAALFADPTRARVLLALVDGRSLPASVLASEAGVSPQAASAQLNRLKRGGLIADEKSGWHRTGWPPTTSRASWKPSPAPPPPSRSGPCGKAPVPPRCVAPRICYDHLAGQLGCELTQALLDQQALHAVDGIDSTRRRRTATRTPVRTRPRR